MDNCLALLFDLSVIYLLCCACMILCRVLSEYNSLPRDMPRDQTTDQQRRLGTSSFKRITDWILLAGLNYQCCPDLSKAKCKSADRGSTALWVRQLKVLCKMSGLGMLNLWVTYGIFAWQMLQGDILKLRIWNRHGSPFFDGRKASCKS